MLLASIHGARMSNGGSPFRKFIRNPLISLPLTLAHLAIPDEKCSGIFHGSEKAISLQFERFYWHYDLWLGLLGTILPRVNYRALNGSYIRQ